MTRGRRVVVAAALRRALAAHARREVPRECCGFLLGTRRRGVEYAVPMANVARGRTRYQIDSRAHIALRRTLREFMPAIEIVGVYHSHPRGSLEPSSTDIAEAYYGNWTYMIVSPAGRIRAFRISRRRVQELEIHWS